MAGKVVLISCRRKNSRTMDKMGKRTSVKDNREIKEKSTQITALGIFLLVTAEEFH